MLWQGRRQSSNVEDRRGIGAGGLAIGGGVIGVIAIIINLLMGGDPSQIPELLPQQQSQPMSPEQTAADDERAQFVKVVLAETEDVWNSIFQKQSNADYPEPTLVLFRNIVQSGCGNASAASGPFYCPPDQKLYIDLSFYEELQNRFNAPGDFAMAYVVAHEVGHHVQQLLGTTEKMARERQRLSETEYNKLSVKLELQADFFAGVWAHYANRAKILEAGDIEEALNAANAIGDDRLQRQAQGTVVPDAFTHGTSEQRMYWFKKGFETGDPSQGNTFSDPSLN
ncbi:MAG: neutral zinc metallopeptidase [Chitinophagaceae bacterium]|nr:neutral zinc metallopeptidase [Chitinophagaceae bacterium]